MKQSVSDDHDNCDAHTRCIQYQELKKHPHVHEVTRIVALAQKLPIATTM